jgi:signal peptidase II
MRASRAYFLGLLACVLALVGCDHATKLAAATALREHGPVVVLPGVVDLAYTENHDVAFDGLSRLSLHAPAAWLALLALSITVAVIVAWVRRRRAPWPVHAGFACIVAGALGNALDRAARGHVVDFIHVRFWPVFNVADILVVAGVAILILWRVAAAGDPRPAP